MRSRPVRPVLKWAGGKSRSLPRILEVLPQEIDTYYEPFAGGAAVFFALAAAKRFKRAVLGDRNAELLSVYQGLKKDVDAVIQVLEGYRHDHDHYYKIRALDPKDLELHERTARIIYLNKTGYNGLYRVNSKGQFNVPFGRYKDPRFLDPEALRAAAAALKNVKLVLGDFEAVCGDAKQGDAVYFDPPYDPVSKTSNFTAYHHDAFGQDDHKRLAKKFKALDRKKVTVVLSNSYTDFTKSLFQSWTVSEISVSRPINSKASARGNVRELLVTNHVGEPVVTRRSRQ